MSYYGDAQWPAGAGAQPTWDHQTPPNRSGLPPNNARRPTGTPIDTASTGASSTISREESAAFWHQFEEVERAIENLVKSGKMFGMPGGRREFQPPFPPGPARNYPGFDPRGPGGPQRPHSIEGFDGRSGPPSSNIQNFYVTQRHQSSRGSNEAEQMIQQKRRMAAQRERELRNYHQEQQYNRTAFADMHFGPGNNGNTSNTGNVSAPKPDRTLSPGGMSEDARRELIARQRSALYGEGPFGDSGGYIDETGTPRSGIPGHHGGPSSLRGSSPLTSDYGRTMPSHLGAGPQQQSNTDVALGANQQQPPSRTSSNASPQSNPPGAKGPLEGTAAHQVNRTSNSSPGGGSPQNGKPTGKTVAPIGTRPSVSSAAQGLINPALARQSTTPLPSPLNHGYAAPGNNDTNSQKTAGGPPNPTSTSTEGTTGLGNWGQRGGPWGSKAQTSVWG